MSWYFEDFKTDSESVLTAEQVINESDVMAFADLSGDRNPLHTDAEFARNTPMGQRVAHGLMALSVATGLSAEAGHLQGTALAFLGIDNWRFHAPVFFGDSIRLRWSVIETRLTSNGQAGVVKRKAEIINQKGDVVQSGVFITLVRARGERG
ncbi:MAG: MaoC/PaaZ C-terminal domain-containing protein [Stagnimonas sp.]|jgi:acyl dehydratase|nr:MaoC/PaaZ C-terminal domain-containing protein [Stagnimonas sp.]